MTTPDPADYEQSRDQPGEQSGAHPSGVPASGFEPWAFVAGTAPWTPSESGAQESLPAGVETWASPDSDDSETTTDTTAEPLGERRPTDDPELWASAVDPVPPPSILPPTAQAAEPTDNPPEPQPPGGSQPPGAAGPPPGTGGGPPAGPPPGTGGPPGPGGPHPPIPPGGATPPYPPGPPLPPPRHGQLAVIVAIVAVLLLCCWIGVLASLIAWGDDLFDGLVNQTWQIIRLTR